MLYATVLIGFAASVDALRIGASPRAPQVAAFTGSDRADLSTAKATLAK